MCPPSAPLFFPPRAQRPYRRTAVSLFKQSGLDEVKLVAHPDMFGAKQAHHDQIGCPMTRKELDRKFDLILSKQPVILSEHLLFLGEIPVT